jgi:AraC-like DNA-binding protein
MMQMNENKHIYLPITEKELSWDLYITGIGLASIPSNAAYPPQGHPDIYDFSWKSGRVLPEYQILFISQGSGTFESSEIGQIKITAPAVVLLLPGVWHRYKPQKDTGWKEHWLSMNGEYLFRLAKRGLLSANEPVFSVCNPLKILDAHNRMWDYLQTHPDSNTHILAAYAMEILALTLENSRQQTPDSPAQFQQEHITDKEVAQALHIIWSHSHRNISVNEIVDQLPVTRRTLERKFNVLRGHCIGREITLCRLTRAKHMLKNTSLPIEHIALASGFSGSDRLGKVFRQYENSTPGQYRKTPR